MTIYNVTGQAVAELSGFGQLGLNSVTWDASGRASGVYFYKLQAGTSIDTKKMLLLK